MLKLLLVNNKYNLHIYKNFFDDYKINKNKYNFELNFNYNYFKRKYNYYFFKRYYPWNKMLFCNISKKLDFVPETYNYTIQKNVCKKEDIWFIKPYNSSCGKGIIVTDNILKYINCYQDQDNMVFQKSVNNLLLYNSKKQDQRIYLLFYKIENKLNVYLYKEGLTRFSSKKFNRSNLSSEYQLTNTSVFTGKNEDSCELFSKNPNYQVLYNQIKKNIYQLIKNYFYSAYLPNNTFHLFGLDFVPDNNYQTWLIEINDNPMGIVDSDPKIIKEMKKKMIYDLFNIVIFNKNIKNNLFELIN